MRERVAQRRWVVEIGVHGRHAELQQRPGHRRALVVQQDAHRQASLPQVVDGGRALAAGAADHEHGCLTVGHDNHPVRLQER